LEPTIFFKPAEGAEIVRKVFGPVVVVDTFKTKEVVLKKANSTEYGLGASICTRDFESRGEGCREAGNRDGDC
jgi:acyl-CoA reductase-like NAD-dependent aldehyde dehydrogenase